MDKKIRIMLVDDHALFREGLARILLSHEGVEIVGEAQDGLEAIARARETVPDLILMDVYMPRCDGVEALASIKKDRPEVKVVMLTICENDEKLFQAITLGADGYLPKKIRPRQLFEMLERVRQGETALSGASMTKVLAEWVRRRSGPESAPCTEEELSCRECEILRLVASGASNAAISRSLNIAESTVKFHIGNILEKLHLENRVQAAVYAVERGLFRRE